jgi:hypothetical protein
MYAFMRLFSLFLVVIALMLLGADAVTSLEHQGQISVRSFETIWALFDTGSLTAFKGWAAHALPGFLVGFLNALLAIPAWSIGVIGVILAFIFGRSKPETA